MASMGQRAMRKQASTAERVFWPFQAGRQRSQKPTLIEALHLSRASADKFYEAVRDAKLRVQDAGVVFVWAKAG